MDRSSQMWLSCASAILSSTSSEIVEGFEIGLHFISQDLLDQNQSSWVVAEPLQYWNVLESGNCPSRKDRLANAAVMTQNVQARLHTMCMYISHQGVRHARGRGHPLSPLSLYFLVVCSFLLFPFLGGFNYFLLLSIPFLSTRIVPLRFQAGGRGSDRTWV